MEFFPSTAPESSGISKANENKIQRQSWGQNLLQGFSFCSTVSCCTKVSQKSLVFQHSFYTWQNKVHSQALPVAYDQFKYSFY